MVRTPARPSGRRRSPAATVPPAACLAGLTLAPGAGAVAEFDYLRIYRP
jgi:hypothetical protein